MILPLLSASFVALALTLYVMLDGFDLGVGMLLLFRRDQASRDHMVDSITPTWDGNETWLILAGVTLLAAFPLAYGILMPALYIPLVIMLLSLGLRGVSFEFRVQTAMGRIWWDRVFAVGSLVAALMQGMVAASLLQGVAVRGSQYFGQLHRKIKKEDPFQNRAGEFCPQATAPMARSFLALCLFLCFTCGLRRFGKNISPARSTSTPTFPYIWQVPIRGYSAVTLFCETLLHQSVA